MVIMVRWKTTENSFFIWLPHVALLILLFLIHGKIDLEPYFLQDVRCPDFRWDNYFNSSWVFSNCHPKENICSKLSHWLFCDIFRLFQLNNLCVRVAFCYFFLFVPHVVLFLCSVVHSEHKLFNLIVMVVCNFMYVDYVLTADNSL